MSFDMSNQSDFVRYAIIDHQQQGAVAGAFEHPAGWQAESNIYWNYQNINLPVVYYARVQSPETSEMLEFLPLECFSWTEPDMGMYMRGQNVGGLINLPPVPPVDALVHLIIPKYRGQRSDLRIIAAQTEPTTVKPPPQIPPQNVYAQKVAVKIEYSENGRVLEEEFRGTHMIIQFPPINNGFAIGYPVSWSLSDLCCFRAEKGRFDNVRQTFLKIQSSFQLNPQWIQLSQQIAQMLLQNSKQVGDELIQSGWERLRMNGEQIRENSERGWQYIQQQQNRINESYNMPPPSPSASNNSERSEYGMHEAFKDMIYEQETVDNTENSANTKVEGYHRYVWRDEFGNLTQSDDPNFDPNVGSHVNWAQVKKRRIGD